MRAGEVLFALTNISLTTSILFGFLYFSGPDSCIRSYSIFSGVGNFLTLTTSITITISLIWFTLKHRNRIFK